MVAAQAAELVAIGAELIQREALHLDARRWDEWLALYAQDCEFWVPTWKDNEELTGDPASEMSHIYYASRAGLEDRVVRLRTGKSPAASPLARTTHFIGGVVAQESPTPSRIALRANWVCHVYFPRLKESHAFFGVAEHELVLRDDAWLIRRKKVVLHNDYIPTMLDFYCI
jgi:3-phenylpropionate/cinnamic acid dioxygenase small subunit